MSGKIKEIKAEQFKAEVLQDDKVIVDFYSTECPPCEALASKYESLSKIYGDDVKFLKIFRQGSRELAEELGVTSSPSLLFYNNGEHVGQTLSGGIKRADIVTNITTLIGKDRSETLKKQIQPKFTETEVIILGGGPAGLTAGIYLGQAHIKTILIDKALPGGYVSTTHLVSNYPGFVEAQPGFMLAHFMSEQAKMAGVELRAAVDVDSINLKNKTVLIDGYETIKAKKIIIATGTSPKPLNIPGEFEYRGNGISYCATCDAKYFEGKHVIVIGGGNSAIEEALFITKFASKVTIVHQFAELQANKEAQKKAFDNEKINFMFEHEPRGFLKHGTMDMEVKAENLKTEELVSVKADGIFIFAGFEANLNRMDEDLKKDRWGYLKADEEMRTNINDVYAVGDIKTKAYRQITTAVADGTIAAISISKELS